MGEQIVLIGTEGRDLNNVNVDDTILTPNSRELVYKKTAEKVYSMKERLFRGEEVVEDVCRDINSGEIIEWDNENLWLHVHKKNSVDYGSRIEKLKSRGLAA